MKANNTLCALLVVLGCLTYVHGYDCYGFPLVMNAQAVPDMPNCCWYSSKTCCTSVVNSVLSGYMKTGMDTMYDVMGGSQCFYGLTSLMCSMCAPDTSKFISGDITSPTVSVCASTCDHLFVSCSGVTKYLPGNWSNVLNGVEFCKVLFKSQDTFMWAGQSVSISVKVDTVPGSTSCYNDVPTSTVQSASCMQAYPEVKPSTGAIAATSSGAVTGANSATTGKASTGATVSTIGGGSTTGEENKHNGLPSSTIIAIVLIAFLAAAGLVGGVLYYLRTRGSNVYAGFLPFSNGPQPITAIHPDDDDEDDRGTSLN